MNRWHQVVIYKVGSQFNREHLAWSSYWCLNWGEAVNLFKKVSNTLSQNQKIIFKKKANRKLFFSIDDDNYELTIITEW